MAYHSYKDKNIKIKKYLIKWANNGSQVSIVEAKNLEEAIIILREETMDNGWIHFSFDKIVDISVIEDDTKE